jgi:diguanylate cyclase (GGDEF)-like protein
MASRMERAWPRRRTYPAAGALLAAGAPLGLALLRAVWSGVAPTPAWLGAELAARAETYAYLAVSTTAVMAGLGWLLGRAEDRLLRGSMHDPLTELFNRRYLEGRLAAEVARATRHRTPLAMLLLDVDGLKAINDAGGHEAGDQALRDVADGLRRTCRGTDVVARWGGDEFAVLAPSTTAREALALAARLKLALEALDAARRPYGRRAPRLSIGAADLTTLDSAKAPAEVLCRAADAALYRAKRAGGNRARAALPRRLEGAPPAATAHQDEDEQPLYATLLTTQ